MKKVLFLALAMVLVSSVAFAGTVTIPIAQQSEGAMGYYVYQNGVKLPYVCLPDCPEIIVEDVPDGNYTYYVTAMVADSLTEVESPPSNEVEVIVNCVLDPPPAPVIGQPQVTCP